MRFAVLPILLLAACTSQRADIDDASPTQVHANDNRVAAGGLRDGVLTLHLEIGEGVWQPERALPTYRVLAFGEAGKSLSTPGPLVRVREGTLVDVTIHSRVGSDITVHGLRQRPEVSSPLLVPAYGSAAVRFRTMLAGTYYYWGTLRNPFDEREGSDSQLTGALVVDPPDGDQGDRVFVIGRHATADEGFGTTNEFGSWVINGQSWPDTERLTYAVGETVKWRWINATSHRHPMHLHGTYFRVISAGDNTHDVPRPTHEQNLVVTQVMQAGSTMSMTWSPARPGNWLFHCHILLHVIPDNRLPLPLWYEEYADLRHHQHMAGLVLGIHALPPRAPIAAGSDAAPRRIALRIAERPGIRYETEGLRAPGLGYAVDGGPITVPGAAIVLERGRPVEIAIANDAAHATSVHWHGIELESYYDGVPHWGGDSRGMTPYIEPRGAFVARVTPPRSGTFIYHTHFNDYIQLTTGLYGALIVVDPGQTFPTDVDHSFIISQGGLDYQKDPVLLNGAVEAPPAALRAGRTHRLRFIGISAAGTVRVRLTRQGQPVIWRSIAKDGAEMPLALRVIRPAEFNISPGETYDFEFSADELGRLDLEVVGQDEWERRASAVLTIER
jgi:FtsP/CotA-like multicopper oxidase with cupredoxin domain